MFARLFGVIRNDYVTRTINHIKENPATYGMATLAVGKALLDNYWVFTSIPLGEDGHNAGVKFLYLLAQTIVNGGIGAGVGHGIDHVRTLRPGYQTL